MNPPSSLEGRCTTKAPSQGATIMCERNRSLGELTVKICASKRPYRACVLTHESSFKFLGALPLVGPILGCRNFVCACDCHSIVRVHIYTRPRNQRDLKVKVSDIFTYESCINYGGRCPPKAQSNGTDISCINGIGSLVDVTFRYTLIPSPFTNMNRDFY